MKKVLRLFIALLRIISTAGQQNAQELKRREEGERKKSQERVLARRSVLECYCCSPESPQPAKAGVSMSMWATAIRTSKLLT